MFAPVVDQLLTLSTIAAANSSVSPLSSPNSAISTGSGRSRSSSRKNQNGNSSHSNNNTNHSSNNESKENNSLTPKYNRNGASAAGAGAGAAGQLIIPKSINISNTTNSSSTADSPSNELSISIDNLKLPIPSESPPPELDSITAEYNRKLSEAAEELAKVNGSNKSIKSIKKESKISTTTTAAIDSDDADAVDGDLDTDISTAANDLTTAKLRYMYRAVKSVTDLFFAVDKELDHLPDKRQSQKPTDLLSGTETIEKLQSNLSIPVTVSPGYGELAREGFDKILYYLQHEIPIEYRLTSESTFLDIGSGFGKCVMHTAIRVKPIKSIGIEYIHTRHLKAQESLHYLRARWIPGLTDLKPSPFQYEHTELDLDCCELLQGDITNIENQSLIFNSTHIYAFDVVFNSSTHSKLFQLIEQSNVTVFACYSRLDKLEKYGLNSFWNIHRIKARTTGAQWFTCYFYVRNQEIKKYRPARNRISNGSNGNNNNNSTSVIVNNNNNNNTSNSKPKKEQSRSGSSTPGSNNSLINNTTDSNSIINSLNNSKRSRPLDPSIPTEFQCLVCNRYYKNQKVLNCHLGKIHHNTLLQKTDDSYSMNGSALRERAKKRIKSRLNNNSISNPLLPSSAAEAAAVESVIVAALNNQTKYEMELAVSVQAKAAAVIAGRNKIKSENNNNNTDADDSDSNINSTTDSDSESESNSPIQNSIQKQHQHQSQHRGRPKKFPSSTVFLIPATSAETLPPLATAPSTPLSQEASDRLIAEQWNSRSRETRHSETIRMHQAFTADKRITKGKQRNSNNNNSSNNNTPPVELESNNETATATATTPVPAATVE